jgi:hypothetical protein
MSVGPFLLFIFALAWSSGARNLGASSHSIYTPEGMSRISKERGELVTGVLSDPSAAPGGNLTLVADEFIWAENLIFDDFGNLWVTDLYQGIVFKITKDAVTGVITKTPWLSGFISLLGLATGPKTTIFFVGKTSKTGETLNFFDVNIRNNWTVVAQTSSLGNGLVYVAETDMLFSASEAFFVPNEGRVFFVENVTHGTPQRTAQLLQSGLNDCDGLFRDDRTNLLYMSEVLTATLYVYNLSADATSTHLPVRTFRAPNMTMLDDMCIVQAIKGTAVSSPSIIAADFWTGNVVAFDVGGTNPGTYVATGIANPTSVRRPKSGSVWDNGRNVFITEGGNFFEKTRRVWELTLPAL